MEALSVASNRLSVQVDSLPRRLPMSLPFEWPQVLDFLGSPLAVEPSQGQLSGDAIAPNRQLHQRIACAPRLASSTWPPDGCASSSPWTATSRPSSAISPPRSRTPPPQRGRPEPTPDAIDFYKPIDSVPVAEWSDRTVMNERTRAGSFPALVVSSHRVDDQGHPRELSPGVMEGSLQKHLSLMR
jgi:hypothetical protein